MVDHGISQMNRVAGLFVRFHLAEFDEPHPAGRASLGADIIPRWQLAWLGKGGNQELQRGWEPGEYGQSRQGPVQASRA